MTKWSDIYMIVSIINKYKVPFDTGDNVRILEKKEKFDQGKQNLVKIYIQLIKGKDIN